MSGPLAGLKVVEFAGLGPAPLAGQFHADLGAEVTLIDRRSGKANPAAVNNRGKRSIALNLKAPEGVEAARRLIAEADSVGVEAVVVVADETPSALLAAIPDDVDGVDVGSALDQHSCEAVDV